MLINKSKGVGGNKISLDQSNVRFHHGEHQAMKEHLGRDI
jgi:hypothetical protein